MSVPIRGTTTGANCIECPFAKMGRPTQPVYGEGAENPKWIIVGESPGQNETVQSRPFVGASGKLVNDALVKIGVKREEIYITNALCCQPTAAATEAQKKKARECCGPRLHQELLQFPGKPIASLGALSAQGFCGERFSITQMAGAYHEVDLLQYPWKPKELVPTALNRLQPVEVVSSPITTSDVRAIIPTVHPAAILRGGAGGKSGGSGAHTSDLMFWALCYDLAKVNLLALGRDIRFKDDIQIEGEDPVKAEKLIEDFLPEALEAKLVAVDTETYVDDPKRHSALQAAHAKLSAIGLATPARGISVAWAILTDRAKALIAEILLDPGITKAFHNGIYDVPVLNKHGFIVSDNRDDTLLLHHSAFPGLSHNLQRVTTQFFAATPWKSEFRASNGTTDELLTYNCRDSLSTARLVAPLTIAIRKSDAEKTYEVDMAMAKAAALMHVKGVPVDRDVNERLRQGFKGHIDKARAALNQKAFEPGVLARFKERLAFEQARRLRKADPVDLDERINKRIDEMESGKKPFNFSIDSGDHIVAFLKACGVPLSLQTASGRISTKKEILESFSQYKEVQALLLYRENTKLLSTFVERMFDRQYPSGKMLYGYADEFSRIHPRWSVHKISGRWGSEAPTCFDGSTEVLTPHGWVRFDQLQENVEVAQFDKLTNEITFVKPTQLFSRWHTGEMISIKNRYIDLLVTPDHRLLFERRRRTKKSNTTTWYREDVIASDYRATGECNSLHTGQFKFGAESWSSDMLRFLCACQADGYWQISGWMFRFSKKRKIIRLCQSLDNLGLTYTCTEETDTNVFNGQPRITTKIYVHSCKLGNDIHALLGKEKKYGAWILGLTKESIEEMIAELPHWDGNFTRGGEYYSSVKDNVDWIQAILALSGRRTMLYPYTGSKLQTKINWQVRFRARTRSSLANAVPKNIPWDAPVYCLSVPTSYIMVRRNRNVTIVGQCQNWPKADPKKDRPNLRAQVVAPHGRSLIAFDAKQLEARLIALVSGDPFLLKIFTDGKDLHSEFARSVWPDFDRKPVDERKVLRDLIKRPEYASMYSSSIETAWRSVVRDYPNVKLSQIAGMIDIMRSKMPGIAAWHQRAVRQAEQNGEIRSILLGRRRCFPIKQFDLPEAINFGIQSSGADLINLGLMDIMPRLPPNAFPILQIHDAVVFECDEDDQDLVKKLVVESFERSVTYEGVTVHFPVDAKSGKSWDVVN